MWAPDPSHYVTAAQKASAAAASTAAQQRVTAFQGDTSRAGLLQQLTSATPAQIDAYVTAHVATLADARTMLATILKLIALDARS